MSRRLYMDASALVKLGRTEPESAALRVWIGGAELFSSQLSEVEVRRSLRRSDMAEVAATVMSDVRLHAIDSSVIHEAWRLDPARLRSLDAIHLATALRLAPELDAFICYDARLADAARAAGLTVESPGR